MATMLVQDKWVLLSEQYLGNSSGNLYVRLWAKLWGSDIATNRSYVYIEAWAYYTGSWIKDNQGSGYVTDGTSRKDGACTYLTNGETKIAGIEGWYTHNNDGTLDLWAEAYLKFPNWSWSGKASAWCTLPRIARKAELISAPDFTDEDSPTIKFTNRAGSAVTTQVCISWTGGDDIRYRNINSPTDTSYTFKFNEDELNKLYDATVSSGSNTIPVTFYVTTWSGSTLIGASTLQRKFTVVNCAPVLEPTIVNYGSTSTRLTGNSNILIRHFNYPRAEFNAIGTKRASIVSKTVTCGAQILTASDDYAQFNNVGSNEFVFTVVDNRGNSVSKTITKEMIDYVIPTCRSIITTDLSSNNEADIDIAISGKCYDGSFGVQDNVIVVEYRYRTNDESYPVDENGLEIWNALDFITDKQNNTYSAQVTLSDLDYKGTYTIQSRVRDTINYSNIYAKEEIVKIIPTFDWGENDFNFNVPVFKEGNPMGYYPIGGIYTSSDSSDPGEKFGGTWELVRMFHGGELIAYSTTWNTDSASTSFSSNTDAGVSDIFVGDNTSNHIVNYIPNILTKSSGTIWVQTFGVVGLVEAYVEISGAAADGCYGIWFKMNNFNPALPETVILTGGGSMQGLGYNYRNVNQIYSGTSSRYFYNIADSDVGSSFYVNPTWMPYGGKFIPCSSGTRCVLQVKAYAKPGYYSWKRTA